MLRSMLHFFLQLQKECPELHHFLRRMHIPYHTLQNHVLETTI